MRVLVQFRSSPEVHAATLRGEALPAFAATTAAPIPGLEHLYTILVDEEAAARSADAEPVEGVYSNPRIEPFGPPEEEPGQPG